MAYFHFGAVSFLLQDHYHEALAEHFMMLILVEDVSAWRAQVEASQVASRYGVKVTEIVTQPWHMKECGPYDLSSVL